MKIFYLQISSCPFWDTCTYEGIIFPFSSFIFPKNVPSLYVIIFSISEIWKNAAPADVGVPGSLVSKCTVWCASKTRTSQKVDLFFPQRAIKFTLWPTSIKKQLKTFYYIIPSLSARSLLLIESAAQKSSNSILFTFFPTLLGTSASVLVEIVTTW